jgi:hypothetical protein
MYRGRSRKSADGFCALPPVVFWVVSAGIRWNWRRWSRVWWCAVRIVGAQVGCRMAIIGGQPPADIRGLTRDNLHRGRAIAARAAIRVHGTIACNVTNVRAVVCGGATAKARYLRSTIQVGKALVIRTSAGPDQAFPGEAAAVHSGFALGVGGARRAHRVGARRPRSPLRRALHRARAMMDWCLPSAFARAATRGAATASRWQ